MTTPQQLQQQIAGMNQGAATPIQRQPESEQLSLYSERGFALIQRIATCFASSPIVPKEYQGNVGACVIAVNMAHRMKADPMMVMQNLYIVHSRPSWSAQFLISCFNTCGRFSSIDYEFSGDGDDYGCVAFATNLATKQKLYGSKITIDMAKSEGWYVKNGSKWKTMPDQMLRYRAASFFIRSVAPEIAMGFQTADEVNDGVVIDVDGVAVTTPTTSAEESKPRQIRKKKEDIKEEETTAQEEPEPQTETPQTIPHIDLEGKSFAEQQKILCKEIMVRKTLADIDALLRPFGWVSEDDVPETDSTLAVMYGSDDGYKYFEVIENTRMQQKEKFLAQEGDGNLEQEIFDEMLGK